MEFAGPLLPGQALVKIRFSGICGKQLEEINATLGPDPFLPHMLGHEGSGVVEAVGPGVKKVASGDRVVLHWVKGSGMEAPTPIYERDGLRVNAGWVTTFNEYAVVPENRITKIPASADLRSASLLGCAATTGVGVILHEANVKAGESVVIYGCGGVGLAAILGATLVDAEPIIAVDPNPKALSLATEFGAHFTIDPNASDPIAAIRQLTKGTGAKVVIVATGAPKAIETAIEMGSCPGSVFLVGVPPRDSKISVDPLSIHRMRTITGSYGGGTRPDRDINRYLELISSGRLPLGRLISRVVSLDTINDGISAVASGLPGRCIVQMGAADE